TVVDIATIAGARIRKAIGDPARDLGRGHAGPAHCHDRTAARACCKNAGVHDRILCDRKSVGSPAAISRSAARINAGASLLAPESADDVARIPSSDRVEKTLAPDRAITDVDIDFASSIVEPPVLRVVQEGLPTQTRIPVERVVALYPDVHLFIR